MMGAQQHTDTEDTYTYTAAKYRSAISRTSKMPRPSLLLSLVALCSLLLLTIDASPVFVDNPSLAQCKFLSHQTDPSTSWVSNPLTLSLSRNPFSNEIQIQIGQQCRRSSTLSWFISIVSQELQHFLSRRLLKVSFREHPRLLQ